jgi:uncharacterized protein YqjF (DUF2071 family)
MSWPCEPEKLASFIPDDMQIDTFEGKAYVSLLPLHMVDIHFRDLPPLPDNSQFPEINLRTYVTVNGMPGVLFLDIEADDLIADIVAKLLFAMPYHQAQMKFEKAGSTFEMNSTRTTSTGQVVGFSAKYEPTGTPAPAKDGSLEQFLIERYDLFVNDKNGVLYKGHIEHDPWLVQPVRAAVEHNDLWRAAGLDITGPAPIIAYSPGTDSKLYPLEVIPPPEPSPCIFPWVMEQNESSALFLHWPVAHEQLSSRIPKGLELDTFEGKAYVGMIPFSMKNVELRLLPGKSTFPELDFFTFVKHADTDVRGLHFLSIDSTVWLACMVARYAFNVPYRLSTISLTESDGELCFKSERKPSGSEPVARFEARYRSKGKAFHAQAGTLTAWLVERYSLFTTGLFGQLLRGDVEHWPWPLQEAEVEITHNTIASAAGIDLGDATPIAHFSQGVHVRTYPVLPLWAYRG